MNKTTISKKAQTMRIKPRTFAAIIFSLFLFMTCTPVSILKISDGEAVLHSSPIPVGYSFTTRYIHSVERTPVEDDYRVVGGKIWAWEERVVSQNAGLPIVIPRNGRLVVDGQWFRFRGGRSAWERFYYRVGDERFGRNILILPGRLQVIHELFRIYPSRRLDFSVRVRPFWEALSKERHL